MVTQHIQYDNKIQSYLATVIVYYITPKLYTVDTDIPQLYNLLRQGQDIQLLSYKFRHYKKQCAYAATRFTSRAKQCRKTHANKKDGILLK